MVDVAGQHADGGRRLAVGPGVVAAADVPDHRREPLEGVPERRPMLEITCPADLLGHRRDKPAAVAVTEQLVPGLDVVEAPWAAATAATCRSAGGRSRRPTARSIQSNSASLSMLRRPSSRMRPHRESMTSSRTEPKSRRYDQRAPLAPSASRSAASANSRSSGSASPSQPADRLVELVLGQLGRRQVAQVLVDPVGRQRADDPLVPPVLGLHVMPPGLRGVPVVPDVVVVEDHR